MNNICQACGMVVRTPTEYHPYAACLMFKACHDGDTVRANLEAVRATPAPGAPGQEAAALKPCRHGHIHCLACMNNRPKPQEAEEDRQIVETYEKLHEGKLGAHWLWCVIEQIAAGVPEAEAFKSYGYYEPARCPCGYPTPCSKKVPVQFCKSSTNRAAVPPQSPELITGVLGDTTGAAAVQAVLSEQQIRHWWASENGLEDCDMCKIDDFRKVVRAVEEKLSAAGEKTS